MNKQGSQAVRLCGKEKRRQNEACRDEEVKQI